AEVLPSTGEEVGRVCLLGVEAVSVHEDAGFQEGPADRLVKRRGRFSPAKARMSDSSWKKAPVKGDAVRVDSYNELDDTISVAMRSFFRQLGSPHLFEERVLPTLRAPEAVVFAAVRDRPWPPWGHGSRRIVSLVQAHSIGQRSYGLGPLYVR